MKAISIILSAVVILAISIVSIAIVLNIGLPVIEKGQEALLISEAKNILLSLDKSIKEILLEGEGSQRIITISTTGGDYYTDAEDDEIYFELVPKSTVIDPGAYKQEGDLIISSGADVSASTYSETPWWNDNYTYRKQIRVNNLASSVLESRYTVNTSFSLNNCVSENKCLASGNDTRIVWYNSSSEENQELDRILEPSTALNFDGSDDKITAPSDTFNNLPQGTWEAWIYPKSIDQITYLFDKEASAAGRVKVILESDETFRVSLEDTYHISSTGFYSADTWIHVAFTWNGSQLRMFKNGIEDSNSPFSSTKVVPDEAGTVHIGRDKDNGLNAFDGIIDELRISNTTRYIDNFIPSRAPFTPDANTVALYHFDIAGNDNPTTAYDSSGNGNNGTINGAYHTDGKIVPNAEANNVIWFATQQNILVSETDSDYYLYYGNPSAGAAPADGNEVYLLYDDFTGTNGDAPDTNKWTTNIGTSGAVDIQNNQLRTYTYGGPSDDTSASFIGSATTFSGNFVAEIDMVSRSGNQNNAYWSFMVENSTVTTFYPVVEHVRERDGSGAWEANFRVWVDGVEQYNQGSNLFLPSDLKIVYDGSTVYTYTSGVLKWSGSWVAPTSLRLIVGDRGGGAGGEDMDARWDNVKARKYISPEPTTSLGTEEINFLTLENSHLLFRMKKLGYPDLVPINTSDLIQLIKIKETDTIVNITDSSIIIDNDAATSKGIGYTKLEQTGENLGKATIKAYVESDSVKYEIYYTLQSNADFIIVEVKNIEYR